jgi:hypothetical protein
MDVLEEVVHHIIIFPAALLKNHRMYVMHVHRGIHAKRLNITMYPGMLKRRQKTTSYTGFHSSFLLLKWLL